MEPNAKPPQQPKQSNPEAELADLRARLASTESKLTESEGKLKAAETALQAEQRKASALQDTVASYERQYAELSAQAAGLEAALVRERNAHEESKVRLGEAVRDRDAFARSNHQLMRRARNAESTRNGVAVLAGGLAMLTAIKGAR